MSSSPAFSKKIVAVGDGGAGKSTLLMVYSQGYFPEVRSPSPHACAPPDPHGAIAEDAFQRYVPTVFENYISYPKHPETGQTVELALWGMSPSPPPPRPFTALPCKSTDRMTHLLTRIRLQDTAGQEDYDRLRPLSYPETDLVFVCFAIDCPPSLDNVMDKVRGLPGAYQATPLAYWTRTSLCLHLPRTQWYPEVSHFCPYTPLILVGLKSDLRTKKTCIEMLKTQGLTPVTSEQGMAVAQKMGAQYMECSSKEMTGVEEVFERAILTVVANDRKMLERQAAAGSGGRNGHGAGAGHDRNHSGGGSNGVTFSSGGTHYSGVGVPKKKKRKCVTF